MLVATLLLVLCGKTLAVDSCGHQCLVDEDCAGCGQAGHCSSPASHTPYPSIAATCVDSPANPPREPTPSINASRWPDRFTAQQRTWTYNDWSNTTAVGKGQFFYDGPGGRTRSEWHPFTDGRDATQVWISGSGSQKSAYYVKSGPLCIYFTITDPGVGGQVGAEFPDWMKRCGDAGMAKYSGRELVDGEWADHYSCVVNYSQVNQTIVFQNWHSLGLGTSRLGLPLQVTGGNSAPNSRKGSPRLNSVWYSNFTVGPDSVKDSDFEKPSWLCIPVGEAEAASFLGVEQLRPSHFAQHEVQRRAHYMPHAKPAASDLRRAKQPKPRREIAGATFREAMAKLNRHLLAEPGLVTKACETFTMQELHSVQRELFLARSPELQGLYAGDRRALPYKSSADLADTHKRQLGWARAKPDLARMVQDGLCHELVMMYTHHLSASARQAIKEGDFRLPLLPVGELHTLPNSAGHETAAAHAGYTAQTSCAICHVVPAVANQTNIVI